MEAKLIVIGGKANKSEVKLKLPTTIGRSRKADLTVAHPKVSRQHCEIFEREGVLMVRDFGSLNGTFIENNRVSEAILKPGDKLTVGPLTFVAVYEHTGALPAPGLDPNDLPTPPIGAIELPPPTKKVGRAGETVAAVPIMPAPKPAPRPIAPPPPAPVAAESPAPPEPESPQPATVRSDAPEEEVEDFGWLTGNVETAPPAAEEPVVPLAAQADGPSPALAETINVNWLEAQASEEKAGDDFPFSEIAAAPAAEDEPSDALNSPPPGDAQDFSWLDDAKDQPLDFSAFEAQGNSTSDPAAESESGSSSPETLEEPGPTVSLPRQGKPADLRFELPPPLAATNEGPAAIDGQEQADGEFSPSDIAPAAADAPDEADLPDFAAMARVAETEEPAESEFPSIVADRPASNAASKTPPPGTSPPSKASAKKGWWPFAGKQGGKNPPDATSAEEPSAAATQDAAEEAPPASPPAVPAAPQFVMPPEDEPAALEAPQSAEANDNEDDALGQFFKSLK